MNKQVIELGFLSDRFFKWVSVSRMMRFVPQRILRAQWKRKAYSRLNFVIYILLFFDTSAAVANIQEHCKRTLSPIIKMICAPEYHSDTKLLGLDYQASLIYEFALFSTKNSAKLKNKQYLWLKERESCQDMSCMIGSTQNRMRELVAIIDGHPDKPASPENSDLKGLWGSDGSAQARYGNILITDNTIVWGGSESFTKNYCKTTYSIEKEPFGTSFQNIFGGTDVVNEKSQFKTYKLKLKSRKCVGNLTYLRFTLPFKIPNYADVIEYYIYDNIFGYLRFGKSNN
jgi:uncharacterized protein